ncbi:hypothetical protein L1D31_01380 [Vibrio sp. Isolate23]|uniref:hypothetical protein n=1 Tax=Vibrio sp. Isolate23 TaxID=2908533 RepID=UPI001EFE374F|nr:hypothetical protein [Vibrio sp. Isolate23]MCG9681205.1 hypothetical protein [Vibrio sp. Isolate23]
MNNRENKDYITPSEATGYFLLAFVVLSVVACLFGSNLPLFKLKAEQVLYLYSTSAQVTAGIYGLTLTGFVFVREELNREVSNDDSLAEVINTLKEQHTKLLFSVTASTFFTIFTCNFVISSDFYTLTDASFYAIHIGQVSFVLNLIFIAYFIFEVISTDRLEKASNILKGQTFIDEEESKSGKLTDFLRNFNAIERILQDYGHEFRFVHEDTKFKNRRRLPNPKLAEILLQAKLIDPSLHDQILTVIKLRNSIVHGAEPTVSESIVALSGTILKKLKDKINELRNDEED